MSRLATAERSFTGRLRTALLLLVAFVAGAASAVAAIEVRDGRPGRSTHQPVTEREAQATQLKRLGVASGDRVLDAMAAGAASGRWLQPTAACRRCVAGPALAAAAIAARTGDPAMLRLSTDTFDRAISTGWDPSAGVLRPAGTGSPDIETAFFAGALGMATVILGERLDAGHRQRYTGVVTAAAEYLQRNGNLAWYTNGNVNLGNSVVLLAAARLSGRLEFRQLYDRSIDFVVAPDQQRWPGRGLVVTRPPTAADGRDGAAYLTEQGDGDPGYDPEYSLFQLDLLVSLDMLGGGPQPRRLANLVTNQVLPLVDRQTWKIDLRQGSRHRGESRIWDLRSVAIPYLATRGRTDLQPMALAGATAMTTRFEQQLENWAPGSQYGTGTFFAGLLA